MLILNLIQLKLVFLQADNCHPLSFMPHDPLYLDSPDQSAPPVIVSHTFDCQFTSSHGD